MDASKSGGGDVVVLRSAGTEAYNTYMYTDLGIPVNSVETIIIDTRAKASIAAIATKIRNAEALFISGGDQATYVSYWKDTPVEDAINYLIIPKKYQLVELVQAVLFWGNTIIVLPIQVFFLLRH